MKLYESYVAEAKASRRRRMAIGIVGAVMLATVALAALLVMNPTGGLRDPLASPCGPAHADQPQACNGPFAGIAGISG